MITSNPGGCRHHRRRLLIKLQADMGQFDDMQPGILLYPLYHCTGDARYKKALDSLMAAIDCYPTTPEGGYFHKADLPEEMWLDGLLHGRSAAARARYGAEFHHQTFLMRLSSG